MKGSGMFLLQFAEARYYLFDEQTLKGCEKRIGHLLIL